MTVHVLWVVVWFAALALGTPLVLATRERERRWAAVGALTVAMLGCVALGATTDWGASPFSVGPLTIDAVTITAGPAMLLCAVALILTAGRAEGTGTEPGWLLGMLALESLALLSESFTTLTLVEALATLALALHAHAQRHRAHCAYLTVGGLASALAGALVLVAPDLAVPAATLAIFAGFVRLGVMPFSTGMLASLQHGPSTATLMASLPLGGVLLVVRAAPMLEGSPGLPIFLDVALFAAPLAAALALAQRELGRSIGYMLSAMHALICVAALDATPSGELSAELLWAGALLSATGFGAAGNLVFLRVGHPDLDRGHGLHPSMRLLSLAFLLFGIGLAGAPGTIEFIAEDVLLNTTHHRGPLALVPVVLTIAMMGFNAIRLHFRLFFGSMQPTRAHLRTKARERLGLGLIGTAVVLGGLVPTMLPLVAGTGWPH